MLSTTKKIGLLSLLALTFVSCAKQSLSSPEPLQEQAVESRSSYQDFTLYNVGTAWVKVSSYTSTFYYEWLDVKITNVNNDKVWLRIVKGTDAEQNVLKTTNGYGYLSMDQLVAPNFGTYTVFVRMDSKVTPSVSINIHKYMSGGID